MLSLLRKQIFCIYFCKNLKFLKLKLFSKTGREQKGRKWKGEDEGKGGERKGIDGEGRGGIRRERNGRNEKKREEEGNGRERNGEFLVLKGCMNISCEEDMSTFMEYNGVEWPTHPGVVDAGEAGLWLVEHQEGGQVGGVGGHDYHGEAGPHHPQHPRREAPRRSLPCRS